MPQRRRSPAIGTPSAAQIRRAREAAGLTQSEAAALVGYSFPQYRRYETGTAPMRPAVWATFCAKLAGRRRLAGRR